ncbi:tRNA adenylyltransferase [Aspergillus candidus]|uniref:Poly A polymerase head domain-containing protein n=1 Tax=Aspergillus candidus TaxID=41067 RepID=A0A2I2FIW4_ASPCN|nr:hypothetical protein BDW47DRAFT_115929 [Aspergillus candidus]PLB40560.1 hypothetical protein BDW47DRAFT_115929 [Aspergillus candidus]
MLRPLPRVFFSNRLPLRLHPPSPRDKISLGSLPVRRGSSSLLRNYSMRRRPTPNSSPERACKKRRVSARVSPHPSTMGQPTPTLELTPIENTLRTLLLDVAEYIRQQAIAKGATEVDAPRTVLRFTGGWVRDKLLGVDSQDIDVGINNMTGYQFGLLLKEYLDDPVRLEAYKRNHPTGELKNSIVSLHKIGANPEKSKHLETVTTRIFGLDVDLVNLRKETYTEDSRNPQMEFGTAEEDALRRDATINALFYNLNESVVEDMTGRGFDDLRDQIIRTPLEPYQTFRDDPLRVLRLIRFASRLGYRIDSGTERAMGNADIREALKLKISRERVGAELEKMLRGPDPHGALGLIDRLGLYTTIFANHQDGVTVDTSNWSLAYDALQKLLHSGDQPESVDRVRRRLIQDEHGAYHAWIIAALAPWSTVPGRVPQGPKAKPFPPRAVEVARDSLRSDNKTTTLLSDATRSFEPIIHVKNALVAGQMEGSPAQVRQQIGLHLRSWKKDWKLCIVMSILQEVMQGGPFLSVVEGYDQFLEYIVAHDLEGVCELKPIANGKDVMEAFGGRKGQWLGQALEMAMQWQLLHPEITDKTKALEHLIQHKQELGIPYQHLANSQICGYRDYVMDNLRRAAREALQRDSEQPLFQYLPDTFQVPTSLDLLWQDISSQNEADTVQVCESLLVIQTFLKLRTSTELSGDYAGSVNSLYGWTSKAALPLPVSAENPDETEGTKRTVEQNRLVADLSTSIIALLSSLLPVHKAANPVDIFIALASYTSEADPWTTEEAYGTATRTLEDACKAARADSLTSFWSIIERILRDRIRPLFAKSKNPAITAAGRKNFHPVPLSRFDASVLDDEVKSWKVREVYATTVFSWVIAQYHSTDRTHLEAHFPLVVPPLLALIDDNSVASKTFGCTLLSQTLVPIKDSKSDILQRTNLASVFEDAIRPCLLSLPTITPEDDSIQLLSAAYPALLSIMAIELQNLSPATTADAKKKAEEAYTKRLATTLRENLLASFTYVSSTNTTNISGNGPSFPYPRLSTVLLNQTSAALQELGIHSTKYLQDVIPPIYNTLTNPFATAHPPLLLAAVAVARVAVLNAHPRLWRWRGELLAGLCYCWLNVLNEEAEIADRAQKNHKSALDDIRARELKRLKKELRGVAYLLKFVLEHPWEMDGTKEQIVAKERIASEMQELVDADEALGKMLTENIDAHDAEFFGIDP